jgi:2-methylcitrate dehydratase PrpD
MIDGSQRAIEFIHELRWADCPPAVQQRACLQLWQALIAMRDGAAIPSACSAASFASLHWPGSQASILGSGGLRAHPSGAAFANAWAAGAWLAHDKNPYNPAQAGAQVVPAGLAAAESAGVQTAALLEALVAGFEIAARAARCEPANPAWGALGCAAAAARLLGLDRLQTWHALGIADYHAHNGEPQGSPGAPAIIEPVGAAHLYAWGALNGMTAAGLAQRGFTGIPSLFSFAACQEQLASLGQQFCFLEFANPLALAGAQPCWRTPEEIEAFVHCDIPGLLEGVFAASPPRKVDPHPHP